PQGREEVLVGRLPLRPYQARNDHNSPYARSHRRKTPRMRFHWTMETCLARLATARFSIRRGNAARHSQPATQFPNWLTKTASEVVLLQICNPTEKNYSPMPNTASLGYTIFENPIPGTLDIIDAAIASLFNVMRRLCGSSWQPIEVWLPRPKPRNT